jgi:hypothetical protein
LTLADELLDAAVAASLVETNDLDWKSEVQPAKGTHRGGTPPMKNDAQPPAAAA